MAISMRKATDIFGEWAEKGKDIGMEKGHAIAVDEMVSFALEERLNIGNNFSFLDVGCGNGWVVRDVANNTLCYRAVGMDGAKQMIANAESRGGDVEYILTDINSFNSSETYDVIHSMEVLYYLENPADVVKKISASWLNEGGRLIVGLDHYHENKDSHSWEEKVGTRMVMLKAAEWVEVFKKSGLVEVESWHSNKHEGWAGTLIITGKK